MKRLIFISAIISAISATNSHAASYVLSDWGDANYFSSNWQTIIDNCPLDTNMFSSGNCATYSPLTFIYYFDDGRCKRVDWCATCPSGYTLSEEFEEGWTLKDLGDLGDDEEGKDKTITRQVCNANSCAGDKYGTYPNCTDCPSYTSADGTAVQGSSVEGNNLTITTCYIPAGCSLNDSTGKFVFTTACHYSN